MVKFTQRGCHQTLVSNNPKELVQTRHSMQTLLQNLKSGDESAAEQIYGRHVEHVRAIVENHLNPRVRGRVGVEDVTQSIFQDVFARFRKGDLNFESDERFCKWMNGIARNKSIKQVRRETAVKRDVGRQERLGGREVEFDRIDELSKPRQRTPYEIAAWNDGFKNAVQSLDVTCRAIVDMLADRRSQLEIAAILGLADRTIRRKMDLIRKAFEPMWTC